jgi:peroxiredoxin
VFCRDYAVQLHRARETFDATGVRLVVIGQGTPAHAREFRRAQSVDLPLLVDETRRSYRAGGTKIATFEELYGPRPIARAIVRTVASRIRQGSIAVHQGRTRGSTAQLGGVLVIAPDSSVRYVHLSDDASDNPPVREVLVAAKAIRPHSENVPR